MAIEDRDADTGTDPGSQAVEERSGRFAVLAEPVFRRLLLGGTCTFMALQMSIIARGWLAFDLTGTNTALGGVLIGFGFASLIAIPTGGVLADRFPKRTVLVVAGTIQTTTSFVLAIAVATDVIAYWMLVVASIVQGFMISLLGPAGWPSSPRPPLGGRSPTGSSCPRRRCSSPA